MSRASAQRKRFVLGSPRKKRRRLVCERNPACWGAVCAGADWSLSTVAPTPTATSSKKKTRKTENSARVHFVEGNNNIIYPTLVFHATPPVSTAKTGAGGHFVGLSRNSGIVRASNQHAAVSTMTTIYPRLTVAEQPENIVCIRYHGGTTESKGLRHRQQPINVIYLPTFTDTI